MCGVDGGGSWGTEEATMEIIRHRTDVIHGIYAAAHTDYEIPCGCCSLVGGLRCEWSYTWSGIFQTQSDIQSINFLATVGIRY